MNRRVAFRIKSTKRIEGTFTTMTIEEASSRIEEIILQHGSRGMNGLRKSMEPGYCARAARLLLDHRGRVLIGTGFPVAGSFESDGPMGGIALYRVLEHLGGSPVFVCAPPISRLLARSFATYEMPIAGWDESRELVRSALKDLRPSAAVSIERPGMAADGHYYNMHGADITPLAAKFDLFFEYARCPKIAFGDGGNEIGMGNVKEALTGLNITAAVTRCDELVIATVSNWGVYGVIALLCCLVRRDLFTLVDPEAAAAYLFANGCLDGVTHHHRHTEDGLPIEVGLKIIGQLRELVGRHFHPAAL